MGMKCDYCDAVFDTYRGKRTHEGMVHESDAAKRVSEALSGRTLSESHKKAISDGQPKGENHWAYGLTGKQHPTYGTQPSGKDALWYGVTGDDHPTSRLKGELNPAWKPDEELVYPSDWNDVLKEFIRALYDHTCQLCGLKQRSPALDVHHMDCNKHNLNHGNLFPFCKSCHRKMEPLSIARQSLPS